MGEAPQKPNRRHSRVPSDSDDPFRDAPTMTGLRRLREFFEYVLDLNPTELHAFLATLRHKDPRFHQRLIPLLENRDAADAFFGRNLAWRDQDGPSWEQLFEKGFSKQRGHKEK